MTREPDLATDPEAVDSYTSIETDSWSEIPTDAVHDTAVDDRTTRAPGDGGSGSGTNSPSSTGSRFSPVELLGLAVAFCCSVFTAWRLHPDLILANTTPAGGDMGAHVWGPAYLRDELLPNFRLAGWTKDWYAGFPAYQFYMVIPSLMILVLDLILPYGVAFKIITVSGVVLMPIAGWFMGRMARLPGVGSMMMALAVTLFLFDKGFTIYGGNIASTLAGEFAFSISLAIGIAYIGVVMRGLQTGRHRGLAAVLLALTGLCHLIPAFFVLLATFVLVLMHAGKGPMRWLFTMGPIAGLLSAFWVLPFAARTAYLNDMGWEKDTKYLESLFPGGRLELDFLTFALPLPSNFIWLWIFVFAIGGLIYSFTRNVRMGFFLAVTAMVLAGVYILIPQNRLWNARLLPFYYLCLYLLAGVGAMGLVETLKSKALKSIAGAVVVFLVLLGVALPLGALPGAAREGNGWKWAGIKTGETNFVSDWARWNYEGYERKNAYPEYYYTVQAMKSVGEDTGCGRAMWEYDSDLNQYGTPMALMLLPFWTEGCIGSMEGLYFEASASTPYHFLNQSELSKAPSRAQRDLPYRDLDLTNGIQHLQLMGVRYYMARSPEAVDASRAHPDLTEVRTTGPWVVFEVADAELVSPMVNLPAVVTDVGMAGDDWLEPSIEFYQDSSRWDTFLAADGPPEWERIVNGQVPVPQPIATPVTVSNIDEGTEKISFDVDQIGQPVLVKTSYFPNWKADGADGPWRVTPNLMVVVPTENTVELSFGRTWVEWISWFLTLLGLVGLVALWRSPKLTMGGGLAVSAGAPAGAALAGDRPDHVRIEPTDAVEQVELERIPPAGVAPVPSPEPELAPEPELVPERLAEEAPVADEAIETSPVGDELIETAPVADELIAAGESVPTEPMSIAPDADDAGLMPPIPNGAAPVANAEPNGELGTPAPSPAPVERALEPRAPGDSKTIADSRPEPVAPESSGLLDPGPALTDEDIRQLDS